MKTFNFFGNCKTLEEVKALYKTLAKEHHPDKGGNLETMQQVNREYKEACIYIAKGKNMTAEETEAEILSAEAYKNAIDAIINLEGIVIELVGAWIWVTGNTYDNRAALREAKFMFASKKSAWYFRTEEYKVNNRQKMSLDEIKAKYGSERISTTGSKVARLQTKY